MLPFGWTIPRVEMELNPFQRFIRSKGILPVRYRNLSPGSLEGEESELVM
jgi:hypothetical protein